MADVTPVSAEPPPIEFDLAGRALGQYQILRRLGRGGMAEVFLAEQIMLRRPVALKVLRRDLARDENYVRRFHHEAQAAASLVHANIVQIYEVGCVEGIHFIAQEYVPGQNLRQLLTKNGACDAGLAASILRQAAAALHKAAEQGIVHRDIKPENIMLSTSGEVKVADFGLARVTAGNGSTLNLTQVGVTMGTPLYMSPEQVEGRSLDPRSDIYSLGVTMYHLLARRPPFEGDTALAVALQHLKKEPDQLESLRPDLPKELCQIVHRMLAKNPDERYQRAGELVKALRALPFDVSADVGAPSFWTESDEERFGGKLAATQRLDALMKNAPAADGGLRWWHVAAMLAAAIVLGGAGAWMLREPPLLTASPTASATAQVEKKENAKAQFFYAVLLNTEAAWKSVPEYFPPSPTATDSPELYYSRRAKQQLARFYLARNDWEAASALFAEFTKITTPVDEEFRAFGWAGLSLVAAARNDTAALDAHMKSLEPLVPKLKGEMASEIERLVRKRQENLPVPKS